MYSGVAEKKKGLQYLMYFSLASIYLIGKNKKYTVSEYIHASVGISTTG